MALQYGCGLRASELLGLELEDIDFDNQLLFVRNSKGRKDRRVKLSQGWIKLMIEYQEAYVWTKSISEDKTEDYTVYRV